MYSELSEVNTNCWIHVFVTAFFLLVHWSMVAYASKLYSNRQSNELETEFIPSFPCKGILIFQTASGKSFRVPNRLAVTTVPIGTEGSMESNVHGVNRGFIVKHDDQMGNLQYMCSTGSCECERPETYHTDGVMIPVSDEDYEESSGSDSDYISEGDIASQATTNTISTIE